jgi:hypothetical protein
MGKKAAKAGAPKRGAVRAVKKAERGPGAGGDGLRKRIETFTLKFLARGYAAVKLGTPLGVFKDGRTLDILAGAFADEVQYGTQFSGLIDPSKLRLPQQDYFAVIEAPGAKVSSITQYLLKQAKAAVPQ